MTTYNVLDCYAIIICIQQRERERERERERNKTGKVVGGSAP